MCVSAAVAPGRDRGHNNEGKRMLHWPGIEPGPPAWQARILPLNHQCLHATVCTVNIFISEHDQSQRETLFFFFHFFCGFKTSHCETCDPSG